MADNRKSRQADFKKGPGWFVYKGGAFDTEWIPQPLRRTRPEPKLDELGNVIMDSQGNAIMEQVGSFVIVRGKVVMGGPPKVVRTEFKDWKVGGVVFKRGEPTRVEDKRLALKLRGMEQFEEVEAIQIETEPEADPEDIEAAPEPAPKKRGRPAKAKAEASA